MPKIGFTTGREERFYQALLRLCRLYRIVNTDVDPKPTELLRIVDLQFADKAPLWEACLHDPVPELDKDIPF